MPLYSVYGVVERLDGAHIFPDTFLVGVGGHNPARVSDNKQTHAKTKETKQKPCLVIVVIVVIVVVCVEKCVVFVQVWCVTLILVPKTTTITTTTMTTAVNISCLADLG